jgi:hypothetical protein
MPGIRQLQAAEEARCRKLKEGCALFAQETAVQKEQEY